MFYLDDVACSGTLYMGFEGESKIHKMKYVLPQITINGRDIKDLTFRFKFDLSDGSIFTSPTLAVSVTGYIEYRIETGAVNVEGEGHVQVVGTYDSEDIIWKSEKKQTYVNPSVNGNIAGDVVPDWINELNTSKQAADDVAADLIRRRDAGEFIGPKGDKGDPRTKEELGLGNVDNTADVNKPISIAQLTVNAATIKQQFNPSGYAVKNYESNNGNVLENFFAAADWTAQGDLAISEDSTNVKRGKTAVKLTATAWGNATKTVSLLLKGSSRRIRMWVYCDCDPATTIGSVAFYLSSTTNFATFFMKYLETQITKRGWNLIEISPFDTWSITGAELWDNTFVRIRIAVTPKAGQTVVLTFSAADFGMWATPMVLLTFDDGLSGVIDHAHLIMAEYGIKGTAYIIGNNIGTAGYMTMANLNTLYADGWALGNHTLAHTDLTSLSVGDCTSAIQGGQDYLINNGFTKAAEHLAYPFGYHPANAETAAANLGVKTARILTSVGFYPNPFKNLELPATMPLNTTTLETLIAQIDSVILSGRSLIICLHNIVDMPSTTYQWSTADFQKLVEYLVHRNIPTCTISEFYNGMNI